MRAEPTAKNPAVMRKNDDSAKNERQNGQKNAGNELQWELKCGDFFDNERVDSDFPRRAEDIKLHFFRIQTENVQKRGGDE